MPNDRPTVYGFLKEIDDPTLRQWHAFTETPLYGFLLNRHRKLQKAAMRRGFYESKSMEEVFMARGEAIGLDHFEQFFDKVRHERKRRIDAAVDEGAVASAQQP
jgi:hypothetical protein